MTCQGKFQYNADTYFAVCFFQGGNIMWTKPTADDRRFGFEVTMYIAAR